MGTKSPWEPLPACPIPHSKAGRCRDGQHTHGTFQPRGRPLCLQTLFLPPASSPTVALHFLGFSIPFLLKITSPPLSRGGAAILASSQCQPLLSCADKAGQGPGRWRQCPRLPAGSWPCCLLQSLSFSPQWQLCPSIHSTARVPGAASGLVLSPADPFHISFYVSAASGRVHHCWLPKPFCGCSSLSAPSRPAWAPPLTLCTGFCHGFLGGACPLLMASRT